MANLIHHSNDYIKKEDHLIDNSNLSGYNIEDFQPTGLYRIRENEECLLNLADSSLKKKNKDNSYLLSKFSNESLYSFSFSSNSGDYQKISSRLDTYNRNYNYYNGMLTASLKSASIKKKLSPLSNFVSTSDQLDSKPKFSHINENIDNKIQDHKLYNVPEAINNLNSTSLSMDNNDIQVIEEESSNEKFLENKNNKSSISNLTTSTIGNKKMIGGPKANLKLNTQNLNSKNYGATPTICNYRSPLRISEQSQATITTDGKLNILTINDIFCGLIKNNSKEKIVGKSVIEILFGFNDNNKNNEYINDNNSNENTNDKNFNRFMKSIKSFAIKHLKHQRDSIIQVIQDDQEQAKEYGINLKSAHGDIPDSPFFFTSPKKSNTSDSTQATDSEKYLRDKVLICGQVVRVQNYDEKDDEFTKSVSIWLKRKTFKSENDYSFYYIWVLEEVKDKVVDMEIDDMGNILNLSKSCKEVFGYNSEDIKQMKLKIQDLIPGVNNSNNIINSIIKMKNFSGKSKDDIYFPVSININEVQIKENNEEGSNENISSLTNLSNSVSSSLNSISNLNESCNQYHVRITAIPNISGIIVSDSNGVIKTCNQIFIKHLLGFSAEELINKDIIDIMPHFWGIVDNMNEEDQRLLNNGGILSASYCKKKANDFPIVSALPGNSKSNEFKDLYLNSFNNNRYNSIKSASVTIKNLKNSLNEFQVKTNGVVMYHKDGSAINVNIKMRKFIPEDSKNSSGCNDDVVYAIWIMYCRNHCENNLPKSIKPVSASEEQNGYNKFREHDIQERIDHFIKKMEEVDASSPVSGGSASEVKEKLEKKSEQKVEEPTVYKWTKPKSIDEFEILDKLGDGAYGVVKLGYRKTDPSQEKVVIKYIIKSKIIADFWIDDEELGRVPKEISILNEIKKKKEDKEVYIVNMIDYFEDKDNFYLITKQHGYGMDLFDYIEFNKEIPEKKIKKMFYQVCRAIQFLHHNNIVHRDIKDENIIVDEDCNTELIDFGSSTHFDRRKTFDTFCGTIDYASPEVLTGHPYVGPPQDVWALGILLYILIYKENPFYNVDEIISAKLRIPFVMSNESLDMIKKLLTRNERARISIDKLFEHPWFSDIINEENNNNK
ncbi:hypothetical protein H8356DRAFT_1013826 [Neocallimastix lanati (nom. inval.)]|jgi:tRNA A-37 threonylcarbamoyl transferase component Bud32|nr:hypothetical protein H8356DRAFT_1013826 [Neocallimastix sp. JGI-2020a]